MCEVNEAVAWFPFTRVVPLTEHSHQQACWLRLARQALRYCIQQHISGFSLLVPVVLPHNRSVSRSKLRLVPLRLVGVRFLSGRA